MNKRLGAIAAIALQTLLATSAWAQHSLTPEDRSLDSLYSSSSAQAVPLLSISLEAATQVINRYSVDVSAVINTWTVTPNYVPTFSSHRVDFVAHAGQRETVVLKSFELKETVSPQDVLDKMLIDGALTFNVTW